jgi:GntR family transcriptional regulator/MocR family aminotransferase
VEDDYDLEFRYDVAPLPALAALDRARVIYLGSASKSVHPGLRIGWLVGPRDVLAAITARRAARHDHPPWPAQRAFLTMLRDGHVDKLVRSARRIYAERSRIVVGALTPYGEIGTPPAGMYLTLPLPGPVAEAVRKQCWRAGFDVPSLADYSRSSPRTGLVIGFGGVTEAQLSRVLDVLTAALARLLPTEDASPRGG